MTAMWIVPTLDELKDRHARVDLGFEVTAVEEFAFEGSEEALAHSIVEAVAHRTHRRAHARLITTFAKGQRSILAAMIGMMNHGGGTALADGHVERLEYQFRTEMGGHGPTDDSAAERVEHHRQIKKAGPGGM